MKKTIVLVMAAALAGAQGLAQAGDAAAGKAKAAVCAGCHGADGHSANPLWPNLAGQKDQYIMKQLKDFRSGARNNNPMMTPMAKPLTDTDIENLAAYFSSQK